MSAYRHIETRNENEVLRDDNVNLDEITQILKTAATTSEATIQPTGGTAKLEGDALNMEWINGGGDSFLGIYYDLGQVYDKIYVQFYVNVLDWSTTPDAYQQFMWATETSSISQEAFEIQINKSTNFLRWYKNNPGSTLLSEYVARGQWAMIGIEIDNIAKTASYYYNQKLISTNASQSRNVQWLVFGGNHPSGTKIQMKDLTVNTSNFSAPTSNLYGIGDRTTIYIDNSVSDLIDTTNFSGLHNALYSIDGDVTYIDGPLKYPSDLQSNYFNPIDGEFAYKAGEVSYLEDLATSNSLKLLGSPTTAEDYYTVTSYGTGTKPIITNGIEYDGAWTIDDVPNNVYRSDVIPNIGNLSGVRMPDIETYALRESTDILDFNTYKGIYFVDGTEILVKLWDETDPTLLNVVLTSNVAYTVNDFSRIRDLGLNSAGIVSGSNSVITYCDFNIGSSLTLNDGSIAKYNDFTENWSGGQYQEATLGGRSANLTFGDNVVFAFNNVEDGYIGGQVDWGTVAPMLAFNVFKNIIVNHVQLSGTNVAHSSSADSIKFGNNTVFVSPRHKTDIPYPMDECSTGHGLVLQSGGLNNWVEAFNNMYLLLFNHTSLSGTGIGNCYSGGGDATITMDYNLYYKSLDCDTWAIYFTSGDDNSFSAHQTRLNTGANTGLDGGIIESHSSIVTTLPVATADGSTTSGKWLTTDPTPTVTGNGYDYDYTVFGLVHNGSGEKLTSSRNIGSH